MTQRQTLGSMQWEISDLNELYHDLVEGRKVAVAEGNGRRLGEIDVAINNIISQSEEIESRLEAEQDARTGKL